MASSLAAAKLAATRSILKDEADVLKSLDIAQTILFAGGMIFLFGNGAVSVAISVLAIGTFVPMLIRRGIAKLRDCVLP